jgi:hypothetical protein
MAIELSGSLVLNLFELGAFCPAFGLYKHSIENVTTYESFFCFC